MIWECDKLPKELSWNELRKKLKTAELKPEYKCKGCVWADNTSGYILCTRQNCIKEKKNEEIRTS